MKSRVQRRKFIPIAVAVICSFVVFALGYSYFSSNPSSSEIPTPPPSQDQVLNKHADRKIAQAIPTEVAPTKRDDEPPPNLEPSSVPKPTTQMQSSKLNPQESDSEAEPPQMHQPQAAPPVTVQLQPKPKPLPIAQTNPSPQVKSEPPPVAQENLSSQPKRWDPEFWLWAGIGENYQNYQQNIPSLAGSARFQNIQSPTLYLSSGFQAQNFGAELVHKETPGEMEAPSGASINNGKFTWKTLSGEILYKPDDSLWRFRGGFQYHSMPFIAYTPSISLLDIKTNSLIMATLGFDRYFHLSKKLRGEWQLRYQYPMSSGTKNSDTFTVSPVLAFDGSVGAVYSVTNTFRLGLFWYGQYHNYRFNYSGNNSFSGEQILFYSNAELRLGLEF